MKSLGSPELPGCLDWYIYNHSGPCPHVPNRAGFFVPLRSTREYNPLVASTLCTVALLIALVSSRETALRG